MSPAGGGTGTCPSCGKPAAGNFCQHCGASLGGRFCNQCGAKLGPGAKFCNQCGTPASGGRRPSPPVAVQGGGASAQRAAAPATVAGNNLPWWIAGAALFGLILAVGWSVVRSQNPPAGSPAGMPPAAGGPAASGMGASSIDLSTMTPIDAADRLFNHVMNDLAQGDTADALRFQPMAVQAYQVAEPLNLDGLFHQSLLENLVDHAGALATAKRILATDPDHILGLGAAAQAALAAGDSSEALGYYKHLVQVYDQEVTKNLPEYDAHKGLLPDYRSEAEAYVATH